MNIQEYIEKSQRDFVDQSVALNLRVVELSKEKATWEMIAAFHKAQQAQDERHASARTYEKLHRQTDSVTRPSSIMRPDLREDGDEWTVTYGACIGRGPTPETACQDFDDKWLGKGEA